MSTGLRTLAHNTLADPGKGKAYSRQEFDADPEKRKLRLRKRTMLTMKRGKLIPGRNMMLIHKLYFPRCEKTITATKRKGVHINMLGMH